jgi:hypothetical protein
VFEQVLKRCIDEKLIGGEGFAVDASVVKADASRQRHHEDDDDDWGGGSRAISEYLGRCRSPSLHYRRRGSFACAEI